MPKMRGFSKFPGAGNQKLSSITCLFVLISVFRPGFPQHWTNGCSLNLENSSSVRKTGCDIKSNWGGFLNHSCCAGTLESYLHGSGMLANKTGQIFLSFAEQQNCLNVGGNSSGGDILSCGIEKLTSNRGGCSNFSVNDVNYRFGSSIRKFTQQCDFSNAVERWEQSCGSCVNSWKEMEVNLLKDGGEFMDGSYSDLCRLSVLITLLSARIMDEQWVEMLFN